MIIWDKLFGTFQAELDDVKPVYGLTRQVNTWNPIKINFLHIGLLFKDAWRTNNVWDKFRIWFMPTGWRPADVIEKYPIPSISDPTLQHKYRPEISVRLKIWAWVQLFINFILLMFLITQVAAIGKTALFIYAFFIFFSVYSYTSLMDKNRYAWVYEIARFIFVLAILKVYNGWFTLDSFIPNGTMILMAYFVISVVVSLAFEFFEFKYETKVDKVRL